MSDIYVTLSGNVTKDPEQFQLPDGSRVTTMRMAVNRRFLDPQTSTWQNRDTTFYTVRCFRRLGDNVQQSVRRGQPVVVYGRLRVRQYERNGEQRYWVEIEAISVGHDLKYGIAAFERPGYAGGAPREAERRALEEATRATETTRAPAVALSESLSESLSEPPSEARGSGMPHHPADADADSVPGGRAGDGVPAEIEVVGDAEGEGEGEGEEPGWPEQRLAA
ncbi:single-stranded DNA-binding protein [Sphaerimonospora cavernae]|uniref:Single-stranded DNA-binding protein n=1 Tax=Sphaerimonospora cavernae TaxID=1740611 RepID=A0ABV6UAT2_9ACTN